MTTETLPRNFEIVENADGTALVRDVPIFAVCEKDGIGLDEKWLDAAVAYHEKAEKDGGHVVPMHIGHHGDESGVLPAGAASRIRKAPVRSRGGQSMLGAIADLLFTDVTAAKRAKGMQLLWRSPEIPLDKATRKPETRFRSLALLDRANPHNELPVLTVKPAKREGARTWSFNLGGPAYALGESSDAVVALIEPESVVSLEEGHEGPGAVVERVKALTAEELAEFRRSFDAFLAEIDLGGAAVEGGPANLMHETGDKAMTTPTTPETPATTPAPDATTSDEVIQLKAEVEALKAKDRQRDARAALDSAVDAAVEKIGPKRGIGRADVLKFAEGFEDGAKAKAVLQYAESIVGLVPEGVADFHEIMAAKAAASADSTPEEVLKLQAEGPDAYAHGLAEHRRWSKQSEATRTRIPLKRWLEIHPQAASTFSRGSEDEE